MISTTMWNSMVSISPWPRKLPSHYRWDFAFVVTIVNDNVRFMISLPTRAAFRRDRHSLCASDLVPFWLVLKQRLVYLKSKFRRWWIMLLCQAPHIPWGILGTLVAVRQISGRLLTEIKAENVNLLNGGCQFRVKFTWSI